MSPERSGGMGEPKSRRDFLQKSGDVVMGATVIAAGLGAEGCKSCEDGEKVDQKEILQLAERVKSSCEFALIRAKSLEKQDKLPDENLIPQLEKKIDRLKRIIFTLSEVPHTDESIRDYGKELTEVANYLKLTFQRIKQYEAARSSAKGVEDEEPESKSESWQVKRVRELGLDREVEPVDPGPPLASFMGTKESYGRNAHELMYKDAKGRTHEIRDATECYLSGMSDECQTGKLKMKNDGSTILSIGATWCKPCREEMADLALLARGMGGVEKGKVMLVMSGAGSLSNVSGMKEERQKMLRGYQGDRQLIDSIEFHADPISSWTEYALPGMELSRKGLVPVTMLLDKEGNIRHVVDGRAVNKEDITKFRQHAAWLQGKRKAKSEVPAEGTGKSDQGMQFKPEAIRRKNRNRPLRKPDLGADDILRQSIKATRRRKDSGRPTLKPKGDRPPKDEIW
ncbi:MAG: hypothetical protein ABII72_03110 [Parcubacteria group bacterium]